MFSLPPTSPFFEIGCPSTAARRARTQAIRDRRAMSGSVEIAERAGGLPECDESNFEPHKNGLENVAAKEAERSRNHDRRVALSGDGYTADEWTALCAEHDNRCARCGSDEKLTVDHIKPVSLGGRNTIDNLQPLCRSCNSVKGTLSTDYRRKK